MRQQAAYQNLIQEQENNSGINKTLTVDNIFFQSIKILSDSVKELSRISSAQMQMISINTKAANFPYVDERFENILIQIPNLSSEVVGSQERKIKIQHFLGTICKKIFSIGFSSIRNQAMSVKKVKVFCSQKLLEFIVKLIKKNELCQEDIKGINDCLIEKILPYFKVKYPHSEEAPNCNLSSYIIPKNNIDDEQNDLVFKSGVKFKLKQSGDYSSEIMEFFNFIIDESNNEKLEFERKMQEIFENIYDRSKLLEMLKFNPRSSKKKSFDQQQENKNTMKQRQGQKTEKEQQDENIMTDKKKQKALQYRQKVQQFTSYKIGAKLPDHIKKFSNKDISLGNLELTDNQLIRIATKWCEELQKYYDAQNIMNRERPYRMSNNTLKFLDKKQMSYILSGLLNKYYEQFPQTYLKKVQKHSIKNQCSFGKQEVSKNLNVYSEEQAIAGSFAVFMFRNCENYLKGYLNSLIHGILFAVSKFEQIIQKIDFNHTKQKKNFNNSKQKKDFNDSKQKKGLLRNYTKKEINDLIQKTQKLPDCQAQMSHQVPCLITFKIGDLLRCKCCSKQEQIKAIYSHLQKISYQKPNDLKIVRVKNKLMKGTRDILINILYKDKMLVEMQLAVKADKSKFIVSSNQFSHYLYELQRAKLGPINQMCSIWAGNDQRAQFFKDQFDRNNKRNQQHKQVCKHKNDSFLSLPFKCYTCKYYYFDCHKSEKHIDCSICNRKICFLCSFESWGIKEQKKQLNLNVSQKQDLSFIYYKGQQQDKLLQEIPDQCQIINIRGGKKIKKKMIKYQESNLKMFFEQKSNNLNLLLSLTSGQTDNQKKMKDLKEILINNIIIISGNSKVDQFQSKKIKANYLLPHYLQNIFKAQKNSINLVAQQFQCQMLKKQSQYPDYKFVKRINLSENLISEPSKISIVANIFPELKELVLNYNKLQTLPEDIKNLGQLELLQVKHNYLNSIPVSLGDLKLLKILVLNDNGLKQFPKQICYLINLVQLNLAGNYLRKVSEQIKNLTSLEILSLQNNAIIGLQKQIGDLKSLKVFNIRVNKDLKDLPKSIECLKNLQQLNLQKCNIQDLPKEIGDLQNLTQLLLDENDLDRLPQQIGSLKSLKKLSLEKNKIKNLPMKIGDLSQLLQLAIYQSQIQIFPDQICNLTSLQKLKFSFNSKLKELPKKIGKLKNIVEMNLCTNLELQQLPASIGDLSNLRILKASQCNLKNLPKQIGRLENLQELFLAHNAINQLPTEIGNLVSLRQLILSKTNFQSFPKEIEGLVNLEQFSLIHNKHPLYQLPKEIGNLTSLKQLRLPTNYLVKIPREIGNLVALQRLFLPNNKIEQLPQEIINLSNLYELDLSQNELIKIPNEIGNLKSLAILSIQRNQIYQLPQSLFKLQYLKLYYTRNDLEEQSQKKICQKKKTGWEAFNIVKVKEPQQKLIANS